MPVMYSPLSVFCFFLLNEDILEVAAIVDGIHAIETQPNRNNAVCPSEQLKARCLLKDCESHCFSHGLKKS